MELILTYPLEYTDKTRTNNDNININKAETNVK